MTATEFPAALEPVEPAARRGLRLRSLPGKPILLFAGIVLVAFVLVGLAGSWLAPQDYRAQELGNRHSPPFLFGGDRDHVLGTDHLGRDVLSRTLVGARISMLVVVLTVPAAALIGTIVGCCAGWMGSWTDKVLSRVIDVQLALPALLFAVFLAGMFGAGLRNVVIILVAWNWAAVARVVRGEVLRIREEPFVEAARAVGASDIRLLARHVAPNFASAVIIMATLDVSAVVLAEAALSFLGLGAGITVPSWGGMVAEARDYMSLAWWPLAVPSAAILLVAMAANLLGDWLRDWLQPRDRAR